MDIIRLEDTIADDLHTKVRTAAVTDYINKRLGERERKIMIMRYGLSGDEPLTQRETAERLGISRSYVSRIENNTLSRIAKYIDSSGK